MEPLQELLKKPSEMTVLKDSQLQGIFEKTRDTVVKLAVEGLQ